MNSVEMWKEERVHEAFLNYRLKEHLGSTINDVILIHQPDQLLVLFAGLGVVYWISDRCTCKASKSSERVSTFVP